MMASVVGETGNIRNLMETVILKRDVKALTLNK